MVTIDFNRALSDAKSASFEALPTGDYNVEVADATATRSSNGKPMIKAQMTVLDGPYANRRVFNNFVLSTENAMAMAIFFRHMKCFGLTETFFAGLGAQGSMEAVASALVQRRARLTLGIRQWQGEDRNEVTSVKPYTGAPAGAAPGVPGPAPLPPPPTAPPVMPPAQPPTPPVAPQPAPAVAAPPAPTSPTATPPQDVPREGLAEFAQPVEAPAPPAPPTAPNLPI